MRDSGISGHLNAERRWRRASACSEMSACVELRLQEDGSIAIRNSRYPYGPVLTYDRQAIGELVAGVKDGEFDDLAV
jgi:hypothetical protein